MFISVHPTLLPVLVYFLFMSEICKELFAYSCRPSATFAWLSVHWFLEEMLLENQPVLLDLSSGQSLMVYFA